ncbi:MAG TPA: potassium channel family protein [Candidatus Acidoferrales bacterium]|nr:potassium channel family protein [Candidatus Acidoferrales bacterium]
MITSAVAGIAIIIVVLWEAFETVVLPRRVARRFRLTVLYYRTTWSVWRAVSRWIGKRARRESFLSFYGPLSLLMLFVVWAVAIIAGFGFLYHSAALAAGIDASLPTLFYMSGTTMFTLGLGDVVPHTPLERGLAVAESGLGFGFLALVLSYLPVIYQAFSRREVSIVLLDARAGSPPTAAELLRRHVGADGARDLEQLLHDWERAAADILESHISYPVVCYFRSQHNNESWLGALVAILDACAILLANQTGPIARQARLTFAICRHTVVDLAQVFYAAPKLSSDRLPDADFERLRSLLASTEFQLRDTPESIAKMGKLREMYEPFVQALARRLAIELPPWILPREVADNWKTSAWGRITSSSRAGTRGDAVHDAHAD